MNKTGEGVCYIFLGGHIHALTQAGLNLGILTHYAPELALRYVVEAGVDLLGTTSFFSHVGQSTN